MAKYDPLREYLRGYAANEIALSFDQIQDVISGNLPPSAHKYRAWWANDETHVHARAWLEVSWRVESVDIAAGAVVFVRASAREGRIEGSERAMAGDDALLEDRQIHVPTSGELWTARSSFEANEPRNLFYRVATELVDAVISGTSSLSVAEALAVLLQTWNRAYYQFRRFDEEHFAEIEALLERYREWLTNARELRIEDFQEEADLVEIFQSFERVLGPVGAAKALHLLAPRCFPLWDRAIARVYGLPLGKRGHNGQRYCRFMAITREQCKRLASHVGLAEDTLKRLDEYNYCKYAKGWI